MVGGAPRDNGGRTKQAAALFASTWLVAEASGGSPSSARAALAG